MKKLEVSIVACTEFDPVSAAALLIFTKHTRLEMNDAGLEIIRENCALNPEWMMSELEYMAKTIRSSWEFLDITFSIRNVSRACAQQITRTRFTPIDGDIFGSYAMQSQRVTDMSSMGWHNPIAESGDLRDAFDEMAEDALKNYKHLTQEGAKLEDARGVLPMNLHCNLIAKYNLRNLVDLIHARSSYRAQGEFNHLAALMRQKLIEMWPWAELFLKPRNELAKAVGDEAMKTILAMRDGNEPVDMHKVGILVSKIIDQIEGSK